MYIVTGAAGFIGSNLIRGLNARGINEIIAVDDLTDGQKFQNLVDCEIADYLDRDAFRAMLRRSPNASVPLAIFHQGACADTTEADGRFMMECNYEFSKEILHWALDRKAPIVYASSASVYGTTGHCVESPEAESPINVYAYSKLLFDRYVRRIFEAGIDSTVVGLRYFNVYGPREWHKGRMASMVSQILWQLRRTGVARLFEGTAGFAHGEQRRDFVFVDDVVNVNCFFGAATAHQGIYNLGTGESRSFNEIARAIIARLGTGRLEYIPFPDSLRGKYQSFTEADINALRKAGYDRPFTTLEDGIDRLLAAEGLLVTSTAEAA